MRKWFTGRRIIMFAKICGMEGIQGMKEKKEDSPLNVVCYKAGDEIRRLKLTVGKENE